MKKVFELFKDVLFTFGILILIFTVLALAIVPRTITDAHNFPQTFHAISHHAKFKLHKRT